MLFHEENKNEGFYCEIALSNHMFKDSQNRLAFYKGSDKSYSKETGLVLFSTRFTKHIGKSFFSYGSRKHTLKNVDKKSYPQLLIYFLLSFSGNLKMFNLFIHKDFRHKIEFKLFFQTTKPKWHHC